MTGDPNRKALLPVGNHGPYKVAMRSFEEHSNVRMGVLPANSALVIQPLGAGVIAVFKKRYHHLVARRTFENYLYGDIKTAAAAEAEGGITGGDIREEGVTEECEGGILEGETGEEEADEYVAKLTKTTKVTMAKFSNSEGRQLAVQAKQQSICDYYHYVPILNDGQKKELVVDSTIDPNAQTAVTDAREDLVDRAAMMDKHLRTAFEQRFPDSRGPLTSQSAQNARSLANRSMVVA